MNNQLPSNKISFERIALDRINNQSETPFRDMLTHGCDFFGGILEAGSLGARLLTNELFIEVQKSNSKVLHSGARLDQEQVESAMMIKLRNQELARAIQAEAAQQ